MGTTGTEGPVFKEIWLEKAEIKYNNLLVSTLLKSNCKRTVIKT